MSKYTIKPTARTPFIERMILRTPVGRKLVDNGINAGIQRGTRTAMRRNITGTSSRTFGYDVGDVNRLTADRPISWLSPDVAIRVYLMNVRDRMRNLWMNDGKARRIISMYQMGTVGPYGMKLQVKGRDTDGTLDTVGNKLVQSHFEFWAEKGNCTIDGRQSFREVQDELVGDEFRDGEAAIRFFHSPKFDYGAKLDLVPTEWIDIWYNVVTDNGLIKMGVEMDKNNRPIAYWIRLPDPATELTGNFLAGTRTRIPAEDFIHGYTKDFARQTRAVSRMAAIGMSLMMRSGYQEATMVRARDAASTDGWIKQGDDSEINVAWDDEDAGGNPVMVKEPGQTKILPKGTEFQPNDSSFPDASYDPFMRNMNEEIASGTDTAYATLTSDLSRANMSSDRAGRLDERDAYLKKQQWLRETFLSPIYYHILPFMFASGQMEINGKKFPFKPQKYRAHDWRGRGWKLFNPLQDINAKQVEELLMLSTGSDDAAEYGDDFEENVETRVNEITMIIDKAKAKGIDPMLLLAGLLPKEPKGALPTNYPPEVTGTPDEAATGQNSLDAETIRLRAQLEEIFSPAQIDQLFKAGNGRNHNGH